MWASIKLCEYVRVCVCVCDQIMMQASLTTFPTVPELALRGLTLSPGVDKLTIFKEHGGKTTRPCQSRTNSLLTPWASLLKQFKEQAGERKEIEGKGRVSLRWAYSMFVCACVCVCGYMWTVLAKDFPPILYIFIQCWQRNLSHCSAELCSHSVLVAGFIVLVSAAVNHLSTVSPVPEHRSWVWSCSVGSHVHMEAATKSCCSWWLLRWTAVAVTAESIVATVGSY